MASEAGVIKSLVLVDFMCHRHLTVEFGTRINFLVGHNGSEFPASLLRAYTDAEGGKSAILTAISIALGGKAVNTGRAAGLKDLIRSGAE
jgi:chromosome segregation ATPase